MRIIRETSVESYKKIKTTISERHRVCMENLSELGEATANELAMFIHNKGITPYFDRNFVHPRLNELVNMGVVEIAGSKKDDITNKRCMTYKLVEVQ